MFSHIYITSLYTGMRCFRNLSVFTPRTQQIIEYLSSETRLSPFNYQIHLETFCLSNYNYHIEPLGEL